MNHVEELQSSTRSEPDVAYSRLTTEADAFTRFIERQRMDVLFELRRLRLGDRPVSGQSNRERIETFLTNNQDQQQHVRVPSARPAVPSAHIADIDALANRRCVTAALGSMAFRRDLENTIRRSVAVQPVPRVSTAVSSPASSPTPSRSPSPLSEDEFPGVQLISSTRSNQPERDAPQPDGLERYD